MKTKQPWSIRIPAWIAAIILFQTLYFKFSAHPESVDLFTKLGVEPWGRWLTGLAELIAGILLIVPAFTHWGALLTAGVMSGAIGSHLLVLGVVGNDGGLLFSLACVVFLCSVFIAFQMRNQLLSYIKK